VLQQYTTNKRMPVSAVSAFSIFLFLFCARLGWCAVDDCLSCAVLSVVCAEFSGGRQRCTNAFFVLAPYRPLLTCPCCRSRAEAAAPKPVDSLKSRLEQVRRLTPTRLLFVLPGLDATACSLTVSKALSGFERERASFILLCIIIHSWKWRLARLRRPRTSCRKRSVHGWLQLDSCRAVQSCVEPLCCVLTLLPALSAPLHRNRGDLYRALDVISFVSCLLSLSVSSSPSRRSTSRTSKSSTSG
jgi:hypothetical protein